MSDMHDEEGALTLYREVHDFFDTDEGEYPEIWLDGLSVDEAQAVYAALLETAAPLTLQQTTWDKEQDAEVPLHEYPTAGRLAAEGWLPALHLVLSRVRWQGSDLPDLGVSVWPGTLALDYRPGSEWSSTTVARFVDLLASLRTLTASAALVLADEASRPLPGEQQHRFQRAVENYLASTR